MSNWTLGKVLEEYLQTLKEGGEQGVEARLKEIREATFKRMAEYADRWEATIARLAKENREDDGG